MPRKYFLSLHIFLCAKYSTRGVVGAVLIFFAYLLIYSHYSYCPHMGTLGTNGYRFSVFESNPKWIVLRGEYLFHLVFDIIIQQISDSRITLNNLVCNISIFWQNIIIWRKKNTSFFPFSCFCSFQKTKTAIKWVNCNLLLASNNLLLILSVWNAY